MSSVILHCHFYQPPRQNPWTGAIDPEDSARPFHDWNQRIHAECYRPNAFSRILNRHNQIERIVNNYTAISFNFGPTLLSWLEHAHRETYARILEADRISLHRRNGHGNAIAQAYNHPILPLCNSRDRRTQIVWGIADFRYRFGRRPEAMWLPETACNDDTLGDLIEAGMRYVILSPQQAERVRPLAGGEWTSVAAGTIDPRMPYRYFHRDRSGRSIAIFFYDGAVSRAIAFEGALYSSQALVDRLERAIGTGALVNVATDGESYGHHSRFGDRSLAYAMEVEAPARGLLITNYGEFLEHHGLAWEVEIKTGPDGEGTAWSCVHGLGRWTRDCGCEAGGQSGWNQQWRGPLRAALDDLRDHAAEVYEQQAGDLFRDPWAARDAYIELILDRKADREGFLARLAGRRLADRDRRRALRLLEMQRNAMLMYTSCGWFFSDLSGIETVQVMKYAGRALDLLAEPDVAMLENRLLENLAQARSNLRSMGNGADVYRRFVPSCRATPARIAAHLAITGLVQSETAGEFGDFTYRRLHHQQHQHGRLIGAVSQLELRSSLTGDHCDYELAALHLGGLDYYCALRPFQDTARLRESAKKLWDRFGMRSLPVLLRIVQEEFGPEEFGLDDLLPGGKHAMCRIVYDDLLKGLSGHFTHLHDEFQRAAEMLNEHGFELPPQIRQMAEFTLNYRLEAEIVHLAGHDDPHAYENALRIAAEIKRHGYRIETTSANTTLTAMVSEKVADAIRTLAPDRISAAVKLIELIRQLASESNLEAAQESIYAALRGDRINSEPLEDLAAALGLSPAIVARGGERPAPTLTDRSLSINAFIPTN
ncbi:MAG: DUF3536 domain-containing protein [Candidatus Binataceae bacterium]|nr:DUF3536 domain-containing protein [Candidatus Binataceae bacterium]